MPLMSSVFYVLGGGVFAAVGCWANLKERLYRKYRNIIAGHPYMSVESIAKVLTLSQFHGGEDPLPREECKAIQEIYFDKRRQL